MAKVKKPKVLLLDIETSFKIAWLWDRYNQNIQMNQILQDTHILTWSAKWLDGRKMYSDALYKHVASYKKDPHNDKPILKTIWKMLNEADYVVAHNGAKFDIPILNSRFIQHGMKPPSHYKVIDTLQIAKSKFRFTSNRLDDLGKALKVGEKLHTDYSLWTRVVLKQDKRAFASMLKYNQQDVRLLERVYKALRPWEKRQPGSHILEKFDKLKCNACGSSHVKKNGSAITQARVFQQYRCNDCGHSMRSPVGQKRSQPLLSL